MSSTTSTATTEKDSLDDFYNDDEDDYYYESNDIDQLFYPSIEQFDIPIGDVDDVTEEIIDGDATVDMKQNAVDYNKYQVEQSESEMMREDVSNYLDAEMSVPDDKSSKDDNAVTKTLDSIDSELFTHSESAAADNSKSFSSRKNNQAAFSVTEANKKRDISEMTPGSVPAKAWIAANNAGAHVKISASTLTIMTIWSSLICLKYFQS